MHVSELNTRDIDNHFGNSETAPCKKTVKVRKRILYCGIKVYTLLIVNKKIPYVDKIPIKFSSVRYESVVDDSS